MKYATTLRGIVMCISVAVGGCERKSAPAPSSQPSAAAATQASGARGAVDVARSAGQRVGQIGSAAVQGVADKVGQSGESTGKSVGEGVATVAAGAAEGAGNVLKSKGERVGQAVGEGLTNVVKGAVQGIDKAVPDQAEGIPLRVSPELQVLGVASSSFQCKLGSCSIYLVNKSPFKGTLLLRALDSQNREIARGKTVADFAADDGQQVSISLNADIALKAPKTFELSLVRANGGVPATQVAHN